MRTSVRITYNIAVIGIACFFPSTVSASQPHTVAFAPYPTSVGRVDRKARAFLLPRGGSDGSPADGGSSGNPILDILKSAGIDIDPSSLSPADADAMGEILAELAAAGKDGTPPDPVTSLKLMQKVMKSAIFTKFMEDPEKLEKSRQAIANNPLMKGMMGGMPGFEDIINNAEKWRETMTAAYEMMVNMGPQELEMMAKMMAASQQQQAGGGAPGIMGGGGAGGDFGMGSGGLGSLGDLPSTATSSSISSALDDLSEDDV
mmetsp:Transcript_19148/g.43599  ORF Transcript_19148/g.43599 Transcript_19148/m.43599 type:complete len:260 (-) Transcript_19148:318-1097(-)|eukprot:CAMPEP_0113310168 /NCGR_PEP_ID=MMETSP0010_2-20120614/7922_1 /TAXON_ID=216773 ORGANISM="Corethron hystrix, Strain 308" /NCGR_SAMPLE_ID=MMETSP0010_2 /ASSEMBLY_ACC=CAM_ASM_000155 /LENGTH=259 /DNA_ID=CAMNT_0000165571 /DNA_START=86 /DNA_END=865 /DNA_ORIENTATION=- /assembly_acc=CAM_ASM_000155